MNAESNTVTLTWTRRELQMMVDSLNRSLPRTPFSLSRSPVRCCCPACAADLQPQQSYCSRCGQHMDWDAQPCRANDESF
jgi:predicted amidophosphoribosyltransferase